MEYSGLQKSRTFTDLKDMFVYSGEFFENVPTVREVFSQRLDKSTAIFMTEGRGQELATLLEKHNAVETFKEKFSSRDTLYRGDQEFFDELLYSIDECALDIWMTLATT